jgi:hypothetical protein
MKQRSLHRSGSWTARIVAVAALCVAAQAMADDAAPSASHPQPNASRATPNSTRTDAATVTTSTTSSAPAVNAPPAPKVICFQNSIRCFPAKASNSATLDLRAPAITRVFSEAELQQKLDDPTEDIHEAPTVQVEGERQVTPVSVGLMAIPWAIVHPTQAWRILMPVPEAK